MQKAIGILSQLALAQAVSVAANAESEAAATTQVQASSETKTQAEYHRPDSYDLQTGLQADPFSVQYPLNKFTRKTRPALSLSGSPGRAQHFKMAPKGQDILHLKHIPRN